MLYRSYRYSQWDGTQRIFELDADELMDRLSDDILNQGDVMQALRDLLRQGVQDRDGQQMPGLRELMDQLKNQRRQQLQQHNMDSVVDDLKERLEDIVNTERQGIKDRLADALEHWKPTTARTAPCRKASTNFCSSVPSSTKNAWTTSPKVWAPSSKS